MKLYFTTRWYGGNVNIAEQAARELDMQLLAVKGIALEDFPGDREYVEGNAEYLFTLDAEDKNEAYRRLFWRGELDKRVRTLYQQWLQAQEER